MRLITLTHTLRAREMAGLLIKSGALQKPMVFASTLVGLLSRKAKMSSVPAWSMILRKNLGTRPFRLHEVILDTKASLL
jgi:hypothetical protein